MSDLYNRFKINIEENGSLDDVSDVVVGVSGGADSVCLLLLLYELSKEKELRLHVVHLNHMLRGEDADKDMDFVYDLCKSLGIGCEIFKENVQAYAKEEGLSFEEAGRLIRYKKFKETAKKNNACIAVAHNMDDNAETFLHHLVRGSDLKGLTGIKAETVLDGVSVIRPLLIFERQEIEEYLNSVGQQYCTDHTNFDIKYTRNKIRNDILSELKKINPSAVKHIYSAATMLENTERFIEAEIDSLYNEIVCFEKGRAYIDIDKAEHSAEIVKNGVIYKALTTLSGSVKDITKTHIKDILSLEHSDSGKRVSLPYGIVAVKENEKIVLKLANDKEPEVQTQRVSVDAAEKEQVTLNLRDGRKMSLEVIGITEENFQLCMEKNLYTKVFDYDKISGSLFLGKREQGDVITLQNGKKLLNRYMIDNKIPADDRDSIPILKDEKEVIWIVGYRISENYKITENTKRGLKVTVSGEKNERS